MIFLLIKLDSYNRKSFARGRSRIYEALWVAFSIMFFRNPFPWPSFIRCALLRLFGAKVGTNVVIRPGVSISFPWRLTIGDNSWIGESVMILSLAEVTIGANCCISQQAFLCTGSHNFHKQSFDLVTSPITIGDGCWIAARSFICPNVAFASGSMCAAGSIVTRDVASQVVVAGNPAKVVKHLSSLEAETLQL